MVDDFYKREEDQKWRERVEERIINLQTSEASQNDQLSEHDEHFNQIDILLEGHPEEKNDNGLKGDVHDLGVSLNKLKAIMEPDSLGTGGVISRLKALEKKAGFEEKVSENRWKFLTAVAVAIISLLGLLFTNLDKIKLPFPKEPPKLEAMKQKAKRPKRKVKPAPEPVHTESDSGLPE